MGEVCITDGIRDQTIKNSEIFETRHRRAGNIKFRLVIKKFTFYYRKVWKDTNCEHKLEL